MKETNFKHTDIGDIPYDWKVVKLGEVGYTYNGITGKSAKDFGKGEAAYITFLNVLNNPIIDTSILESVNIAKSENQNSVKKGDLFFNTSSETPEDVGTCAVLLEDIDNVYLNSFCFGYRLTDSSILGKYLAYYFRSKQGRNLMTKLAQGATRYNLSKVNFNNSYIPLPPTIADQERIATALSDIDNLIAHLDLIIDKKKNIKQGAMQQLLTAKTRLNGFNDKWVTKKLGEISRLYQPATISQSQCTNYGYDVYGANGIIGKYPFYNHDNDQVVVTCRGNTCGKVNKTKGKCWITGNAMVVNVDEYDIDKTFLFYLLSNSDLSTLVTGSGQPQIVRTSIENFYIPLPSSLAEQKAIADTLTAMDNEIQALQSQRDKYTLIKQGMMQQLLTGKIRI